MLKQISNHTCKIKKKISGQKGPVEYSRSIQNRPQKGSTTDPKIRPKTTSPRSPRDQHRDSNQGSRIDAETRRLKGFAKDRSRTLKKSSIRRIRNVSCFWRIRTEIPYKNSSNSKNKKPCHDWFND